MARGRRHRVRDDHADRPSRLPGGAGVLFGAYAFGDGALAVASAFQLGRADQPWWVLLIEGVAGLIAGVVAVMWPAITAVALTYVIAVWALVTGVLEIVAAVRLRRVISGEWLLVVTGIASLAIGTLLIVFPGAGMFALVICIGAYAFVFGVLLLALGLRLRSWQARGQG